MKLFWAVCVGILNLCLNMSRWYFCNEQQGVIPLNYEIINPLRVNHTKWSNTLKQFVGKLPANCLSVFDHFVGLALKGLNYLLVFDIKTLEKMPMLFT